MSETATSPAVILLDGGVCRISGELDFTTARHALESVELLINDNATLEINLADVGRSNSAGLALMIEWLAIARRRKHEVTFSHIPDGLRQLARVCQVDGLI